MHCSDCLVHALEVRASIPDDLEDMDTSRPTWLPEDVQHLGEAEGWKLPDLIHASFWDQAFPQSTSNQDARREEEQRQEQLRQERMQSEEFQEQAETGTGRQMRQEQQERATDDIQCITCGGTNNAEDIVLCEGAAVGSEFFTGLHTHPKVGWHSSCIPDAQLEVPLSELQESPENLDWCCKDCSVHLAAQNIYLGWKIVNQRVVSGRQVYTVQWLGQQPDSDQHYSDVKGTAIHAQWLASRRGR